MQVLRTGIIYMIVIRFTEKYLRFHLSVTLQTASILICQRLMTSFMLIFPPKITLHKAMQRKQSAPFLLLTGNGIFTQTNSILI